MSKPTVAFFDFASCEGCQLSAINLAPQQLLELLDVIDIVEFREALSEKAYHYDITLIEGSITRKSDIPRLQDIRNRSDLVVAFGACAHIGGINALKNFQRPEEYKKAVYPDTPDLFETDSAHPISAFIKVDAFIPGCPIDTDEFVRVVKNIVLGKNPDIPDYPVCVECKQRENICVYELGLTCLGPVIRAGCGARCPSNGGYCYGCRGAIPEPNIYGQKDVMRQYHLTHDQMMDQFKLFLNHNKEVF